MHAYEPVENLQQKVTAQLHILITFKNTCKHFNQFSHFYFYFSTVCMHVFTVQVNKYIHLNIQHYLSSLIAWEHIPDTCEFITQSADLLVTWIRL